MKIAYIGTYPPRQCGIATFTNNLIKAVVSNSTNKSMRSNAFVVAMNDQGEYDYPEEVRFSIRQNHQRDYINAARSINMSDSGVCIIEHEFGIFGGDDGVYILPLIHRLRIPLIVTFHTVLKDPTFTQKAITVEIGKKADKIVVMSNKAVSFLKDIYGIPEEKIELVEHGVPDFNITSRKEIKEKFNFQGRKVLFTFGLLSPNKGIETVIHALPSLVKKHPDILYIVLGQTHPGVKRAFGESYRNHLNKLVKEYHLENNVFFINNYATEEDLFEYLQASDVYITPYLNEAQITSGTLSYAVGAGMAVVSTPYWHAQELLDEGRGILFDFQDSEKLSSILNDLFNDPEYLNQLRNKAFDYGEKIRWPMVGKRYLTMAWKLQEEMPIKEAVKDEILDPSLLPNFRLDHISRLTDDTGIVQHAKYGIPNLKEGYCVDDNARALLMATMAYKQNKSQIALNFMPVYLSYIHYMQNDNGTFRNFLSFSRHYLDEEGSEDSFGRAIWSLGYLVSHAPSGSYKEIGKNIFDHSIQQFEKVESIRGIANTIIGICYYLKAYSTHDQLVRILKNLTNKLTSAYQQTKDNEWQWFEDFMTYDNGILPLAIFHSCEILNEPELCHIAEESTTFLESVTFKNDYLSVVGNKGWYQKGGECPVFDQQSIDVMAMVLLYNQAYVVTKKERYIKQLLKSYMWFLGDNELRLPLYDYEVCGCNDGLEETGVNRNQGAESTLAYLISHITVLKSFEIEQMGDKLKN